MKIQFFFNRKMIQIFGAIVFIVTASGCLEQSSQPYYLKEYRVDLPELNGAWDLVDKDPNPEEATATWFIEGEDLKVTEAAAAISYLKIVFFQIDNDLFADLTAGELRNNSVGIHWFVHVVPIHTLAKVMISQDSVNLSPLDEEWLNQNLENGSVSLRHLKTSGSRLFTADSKDWIEFLRKNKDQEGIFDNENSYILIRNSSKEEFPEIYQNWLDFLNSFPDRRLGDYTLSEPYQAIIELGEPVIPFLIAHMREGEQTFWQESQFFLWHAVRFLSGIDLSDKKDLLSDQEIALKYIQWWDSRMKEEGERKK